MDRALSSVALSAWGVSMAGLGVPERTATPTDASDVGSRPGHEPILGVSILEHLPWNHRNVEVPATDCQLDQFGCGAEAKDELVGGRAFKLCGEFA